MFETNLLKTSLLGTFHLKDSSVTKKGAFWINQNNELICSPDGKDKNKMSIIHNDPLMITPQFSLTVYDSLGDSIDNTIYGDLKSGLKISMFNTSIVTQYVVNNAKQESYFAFKKPFTTYHVDYAIIGNSNIAILPSVFDFVDVSYTNLCEITTQIFKNANNSSKDENSIIRIDDFYLLLMHSLQQSTLMFIPNEQQNIAWYFEKINSFRNFLICITGLPIYISNIFINDDNNLHVLLSEFGRKLNYNYYGNYWEINWRAYLNQEIYEAAITNWFTKINDETYIDNFTTSINSNAPASMRYFSLISALESFHKKTNPISMVLNSRLKDLIGSISNILPKLADLMIKEIDFYVNTRNFVGHAKQISSQPTFDLNSNPSPIFALHVLMQILILKEIGIDDNLLKVMVNNTALFVNIRE